MIAEALTVLLLWTNPALNADSTACTDLAGINIRAHRESDGYTMLTDVPMCDEDGTCRSGPGAPDSSRFTYPKREGQDWWQFNLTAYDSTGNISDPSNTVRLDLGSGGPITGVGVAGPPPGPIVDEWYDVRGRRIERPVASGVYFRRRGTVVEKVVLIK